ncbi:adenylate/guanylate cyclase domain-containing protein [Rhizobium sullae]|nr:adenylate/guanylate cyclase domain-containing protein [Rhizobium sullae]
MGRLTHAGVIGTRKLLYDVWGDTVNTLHGWNRTVQLAGFR